jgi:hypothetical protein
MEKHPDFNQWRIESPWSSYNGNDYTISADSISADQYNGVYPINGNLRYVVGYVPSDRYNSLFSDKSVNFMSYMITLSLKKIYPNKNIIVPEKTIRSICDTIHEGVSSSVDVMQKMVVGHIVQSIQLEYDTIEKNNKLSIWVTNYTDDTGMKKFNGVKLNNKQRSHSSFWKY